jgi:hypothetical protein
VRPVFQKKKFFLKNTQPYPPPRDSKGKKGGATVTEHQKLTAPVTHILHTPAFEEAYLELTRYAYTRTRNAAEAGEVVSDTVLSWM